MILIESEAIRFQILENIFAILSHPVSQLLHLRSLSKTIEVLIIAHQNYGLPQFKDAILHMFNKFYASINQIIALGFAPEILALRKYLEVLLKNIAGTSGKELEVDMHSLDAFRNMTRLFKTVCCSIATQIVDQDKVTKSSIDIVLNIMKGNSDIQIYTQSEFLAKKSPDKIVDVKSEIDRASKEKRYPSKDMMESVHMQYVVDTYSFESLFFIMRDLMMNPLYPNSLAI